MNYDDYKRGWVSGGRETPCGAGSTLENTVKQREWIPRMVKKHKIKSIADLGAGDMNWIRHTELGCDYSAYDLIPRSDFVIEFDILEDTIPDADCVMVNWVLNHFSEVDAKIATANIKKSKAHYLITTYSDEFCSFTDGEVVDSINIRAGFEMRLIDLGKKAKKKAKKKK